MKLVDYTMLVAKLGGHYFTLDGGSMGRCFKCHHLADVDVALELIWNALTRGEYEMVVEKLNALYGGTNRESRLPEYRSKPTLHRGHWEAVNCFDATLLFTALAETIKIEG